MKTQIKKLPKSEVELEIEVPAEEFNKFIEGAIFELGKDLEIEGFRKGKAPKEIIEKTIDPEKILKEAAEKAVKENYIKAVLENKIEVLGQPEIEILSPTTFQENTFNQTKSTKSGGGFMFKARVAVMPEIQLPDYRKIASQIKKREIFIQEKEIEGTLKWLQRSRAKFSQIARPCQKGDFVEIEYHSPQVENNKNQKDGFILGQGYLIPGFEEKLEGMEQGEKKEFSLEFPLQHLQKNLAGKTLNFEVEMVSVKIMELPQIDDQFVQSLGKFGDLNSLKENIKEGIKFEKEMLERQRVHQEVLNKITEAIFWEIPEILIETEKNRMIEDLKSLVKEKFQVDFEEYLVRINKSEKEIKDSFGAQAERKIKNSLILREIAKKENITATEDEVKAKINQFLKNYHSPEKTKEVDQARLKSYYEEAIRNEKVLQVLENLIQK